MKRQLSLWIVMLTLLCVPSCMQAVTVKFKYVSGGEDITSQLSSKSVSIYKNGAYLTKASWDSYYDYSLGYTVQGDGSVVLDDALVGTTLAYVSSLGHKAEFTVQANESTIELNCSKLTVTTKDEEGNAISSSISLSGKTSTTVSTNESGMGVAYVVPGLYIYSWNYGSDTIDLTTDNALSLTAKVEKIEEKQTYSLRIQPRYGNYPVDYDDYYYLFKSGNQLNSIYRNTDYMSGRTYWGTSVTAGTYEIRDQMGGTSGEVTIESDTTIYLDYQKVTFTSKCGSNPNVNQGIKVERLGESSSYYTGVSFFNKLTDANGSAEFYLLSGNYQYRAAGGTTEFTVAKEDLAINIETVLLTFKVQCSDMSAVKFVVNNETLTPVDGVINYGCMPGSEVKLEAWNVSGESAYTVFSTGFTVTADASKTVDVKLHTLQFTSNNTNSSGIIVRGEKTLSGFNSGLSWNKKYYLIEGAYAYQDPATSEYIAINLTEDKTIDFNFATVTVNVVDTDGKAVPDTSVSFGNNSARTDNLGTAVFHCVPGSYKLSWNNNAVSETIVVEGDMQTSLTIPALVSFNVVGLNSSYASFRTVDNDYVGTIYKGENSLRLNPATEYTIGGYHGTAKITNGCTITLGTLRISSEGMGLAFPMENWEAVSNYGVIVGSTARLTAIPVSDDKFTKWTINGNDYDTPVIDFKITEQDNTATAIFGGSETSRIQGVQDSQPLDFNDRYITLPNDMKGMATIYTLDGKQMKQLGVAGNQIGIYDLPTGAYILSFKHDGGVITARFIKK